MNIKPKYSFILGGLLAGIGWVIAWPENFENEEKVGGVESPEKKRRSRIASRSPEQLHELVERLKDSSDRIKQREATRELRSLKDNEIRGLLLDTVGDFSGHPWEYPEAGKLLLIELGRRDPAAALAWSWENIRESRGWSHAFEQIGPQWAWDDPEEFFHFSKEHFRQGSYERELTMKEVLASPDPILERQKANKIQLWLVKSSPRLAFRFMRLSLEKMYQSELIDSLHSETDFASALSAWDDYDPKAEEDIQKALNEAIAKRNGDRDDESLQKAVNLVSRQFQMVRHPSHNLTVRSICKRWKENHPDSFAKSPYAGWDERR